MRRTAFAVGVIALLLAAPIVAGQRWSTVRAQEASPVAEEASELPPGVALAVLHQLAPVDLPDEPAALAVVRVTVEPGTEVPVHPHPGLEIAFVEAGSVTIQTSEGPAVEIVHGAAGTEAAPESVGPGEELTLVTGDIGIFTAGNFSGGRAGDEGVTVLVFEFGPAAGEGTPEA